MAILMTDGQNNVCYRDGTLTTNDATYCMSHDQDDMVASAVYARDNSVVVYTIGFGDQSEIDPLELTNMALLTGGKYYPAPDAATLMHIYQHIGE